MSGLRSALVLLVAAFLAAPAMAAPGGAEFDAGAREIRVTALRDDILHVEMTDAAGRWPEAASWAVSSAARAGAATVDRLEYGFSTDSVIVEFDPANHRLSIKDKNGATVIDSITVDPRGDANGFALSVSMPQGQRIFGMGDKTGALDRAGRSFVNWNTDAYNFTSATDPIYKSIPFYVAAGGGAPYGLFLDNTFRTGFDFGARRPGVIAIDADDGPADFYIMTGASVRDIVRGYAFLTGLAPLPPRWAFGYQQSRWSYMNEDEVRTLVARFDAERFPLDVVWFDIDYQDRNRPFTIDRKAFPHFEKLIADLKRAGVYSVPIVDMHIAAAAGEDYAPYEAGRAGDHFLKRADGTTYVAPVWPGPSVFPDFTEARTRRWWGGLLRMFARIGVAGIWNDMNEPAIFETPTKTMPLDNIHRISGDGFSPRTATHAEIHNVYGMQNSRATFEGLLALNPRERPFVMTRASYAGGQRYSTTWTGDNSSSFDHLKLAVQQMQNLGLSGFAFSANDVGGFTGGPSAELLTRWFQYAAFMPLFRNHSQKDAPRAEPWIDGEAELAIRRRYVEERYRLLPFLYGLAADSSRTGDPMMRPPFYDFADALSSGCDQSMHFTLGGRLLIAGNPRAESPRAYEACLPEGDWYDYWTGAPVGRERPLMITPSHDKLPVFVRAGSIIPRQTPVLHTDDRPEGPLELHVYPGESCAGVLYDDDGRRNGAARRQEISCAVDASDAVAVSFAPPKGSLQSPRRKMTLIVHGAGAERTLPIAAPERATTVRIPPA